MSGVRFPHSPVHPSLLVLAAAALLSGCMATTPSVGSGRSATPVSGAAGGATTEAANDQLERCPQALGTLRIEENTNASWYGDYNRAHRLGSTVPVLRTMIQQSNCFVIVERGRTMGALQAERDLMRSGEGRSGSNYGGGQIAAADYTLSPEVLMSSRQNNATVRAATNRLTGVLGGVAQAAAGSMATNEAATTLLLIDNRSSVQIAAAEGYSKNIDFGVAGLSLGSGTALEGSAYANTPQGKVVVASFVDAYNKMVVALRNYRAQTVEGGLGTGGRLGVQGGQTPASRDVKSR